MAGWRGFHNRARGSTWPVLWSRTVHSRQGPIWKVPRRCFVTPKDTVQTLRRFDVDMQLGSEASRVCSKRKKATASHLRLAASVRDCIRVVPNPPCSVGIALKLSIEA